MKKLNLDSDTKNIISEVSTIMGVDDKLIYSVLENLVIAWSLQIIKNEDKRVSRISIPFLGSIGILYKGDQIDPSKDEYFAEAEYFVSVNDEFAHLLYELKNNKDDYLSSFIKDKICRDYSNE